MVVRRSPHKTYDNGGPNPSDRLKECTEQGLMSGGLPSTSLKDVRRERERMSEQGHPPGQGTNYPCVGMDAEFQNKYRQEMAGNRPKKDNY